MKKALVALITLILLITVIVVYRAHSVFADNQFKPEQALTPIPLDAIGAVERFAESIRFRTISYEDPTKFDDAAFEGLIAHIEASFPLVHQQMEQSRVNKYSLVYKLQGSNASLKPALFMGHTDVVPVDEATRSDWSHGPFSGDIAGDIIWGRGALDDKVTVLALLEAMETLLERGLSPQRTIYFAFGHDEEIGGNNGAAVIAEDFARQGIEFEFVLDEGGAVTEGLMAGVSAPVAIIGIAEKGYANLRLTVKDAGGHSSQPPVNTAVGILSEAIVALENNQFPADLQFIEGTFDKIGFYTEFATRMSMSNLWLFSPLVEKAMLGKPNTAASVRTTTAATMVQGSSKSNILPTQAIGVVNYRLLPGDTVEKLKAHAIAAINNPRVNVEVYMANEASKVSSTDSYGYRLLEQTIRKLDDSILVAPYLVQGGTDAKHFTDLSNSIYRFMMVRFNAESLKRFHGINEQIPVEDYLQAIQLYAAMIEAAASGNTDL